MPELTESKIKRIDYLNKSKQSVWLLLLLSLCVPIIGLIGVALCLTYAIESHFLLKKYGDEMEGRTFAELSSARTTFFVVAMIPVVLFALLFIFVLIAELLSAA